MIFRYPRAPKEGQGGDGPGPSVGCGAELSSRPPTGAGASGAAWGDPGGGGMVGTPKKNMGDTTKMGVLWMFNGCFVGVSWVFCGCFMDV